MKIRLLSYDNNLIIEEITITEKGTVIPPSPPRSKRKIFYPEKETMKVVKPCNCKLKGGGGGKEILYKQLEKEEKCLYDTLVQRL